MTVEKYSTRIELKPEIKKRKNALKGVYSYPELVRIGIETVEKNDAIGVPSRFFNPITGELCE